MSSVQTMGGAARRIDPSRGRAVVHPGLLFIEIPSVSRGGKRSQKMPANEKGLECGIPETPTRVTGLLLKWGRGNEASLRLVDAKNVAWHDRVHFLSVAARVMRRILVDHARAGRARKRGGGAAKVTF